MAGFVIAMLIFFIALTFYTKDRKRKKVEQMQVQKLFTDRLPANSKALKKLSEIERFESFIFYSPDGCWYWTGAVSHRYGYFTFQMQQHKAHRRAYELYIGPITNGLFVCHACDNPLCVNPCHLFLGTAKDNNTDRKLKGRNRDQHGTNHNFARLDETSVIVIREAIDAGFKQKDIAKYFRVGFKQISLIKLRKRWTHI